MKLLNSGTMSKTVIGGGMDSLIEGNTKPFPFSEKLSNTEERASPPIENGNNGNRWNFLRKSRKSIIQTRCSSCPEPESKTALFGQLLSKVCNEDETLPKPITDILTLLLKRGSTTEGVFRRTGSNKCLKEIKEQLNDGVQVDMEAKPTILLAALFKDFLRELPGSLLMSELYKAWMSALEKQDVHERCTELKMVTDRLPKANVVLLQYLLCVLHHISKHADTNKMDAHNLAVCIAPNLLQCDNLENLEKVTVLTEFLIENCCKIFGEDIQSLLGNPDEDEQAENLDSLSSNQHDSAYDSTDPDGDGDVVSVVRSQQEKAVDDEQFLHSSLSAACRAQRSTDSSCSSVALPPASTKPLPRRCSEPILFSPVKVEEQRVLARSHDNVSTEHDDPFLRSGSSARPLELLNLMPVTLATNPKGCFFSSSCSLESSYSNLSECSMFTSSPLPSPLNGRKSDDDQDEAPKQNEEVQKCEEVQKHEKVKRRPQSMKTEKKRSLKTRSWASFTNHRGSSKKWDTQKVITFSCETLQEDSQSETDHADLSPRPRPHSAIEVFQHVDSRIAGKPPSYTQAIHSNAQPAPPEYHRMTVQDAWRLQRSRPSSMTEELLQSCPSNTLANFFSHIQDSVAVDHPSIALHSQSYHLRAMSESVSRSHKEDVSRRCSQTCFEEISYAKESYV